MLGYKELLSNLDYPPELHNKLAAARSPHYVTFKEHYCYSPSLTVPWQDEEEWFKNGFLPPGCRIIDIEVGLLPLASSRSDSLQFVFTGWSAYNRRQGLLQLLLRDIQT